MATIIDSDDLLRADENPLSDGGAWFSPCYPTAWTGHPRLSGNLIKPPFTNAICGSIRTVGTYSPDQYSEITKADSLTSTNPVLGCIVRAADNANFYYVHFTTIGGDVQIVSVKANVPRSIGAVIPYPSALAAGDKIRLTVEGTKLDVLVNGVSLTGGTGRTDTLNDHTAGRPGLTSYYVSSNGANISYWEGGNLGNVPGTPGTMTMPSFDTMSGVGLPGSYGVAGTVNLPPSNLELWSTLTGYVGYVGTPESLTLGIQYIWQAGYASSLPMPMATLFSVGLPGSFGLAGTVDLPPLTLYMASAGSIINGAPGTMDMPTMGIVFQGTPAAIEMPVAMLNMFGERGSYGVFDYPALPIARMAGYGEDVGFTSTPGTMEMPVARFSLDGLATGYGPATLGLYTLPIQTLVAAGVPLAGVAAMLLPAMALSILVDNLDYAVSSDYLLHALNTMNGSVTRLPYAANSFCELDGVLYAAGPAGIMIFEGANKNNGADIDSRIAKGGMDFGTSKTKRMTDLYMLCRTAGSIKATSSSELDSGAVTTEDAFDIFHGFKSDLPRGVKGRQLGIAVENVAGCDFELAELEFEVEISENRRGRQIRN